MLVTHLSVPIRHYGVSLKRAVCETWLSSGSTLRHLLRPHLSHPLSCESRNENEMLFQPSLSRMSAAAANGPFQKRSETEWQEGSERRYWLWIYSNLMCLLCLLTFWQVCLLLRFTGLKMPLSLTLYAYLKEPMFYSRWSFNTMTNYNWQQVSVYRLKIIWFTISVLY